MNTIRYPGAAAGLAAAAILTGGCADPVTPREPAPVEAPRDDARPAAQAGPEAVAVNTVARALGVDAQAVAVISIEAVEFPDSGLGCPEPGMSYQQVITPGHRALVEAAGRRFDIRISGGHGRICYRRKGRPLEHDGGNGEPPGRDANPGTAYR